MVGLRKEKWSFSLLLFSLSISPSLSLSLSLSLSQTKRNDSHWSSLRRSSAASGCAPGAGTTSSNELATSTVLVAAPTDPSRQPATQAVAAASSPLPPLELLLVTLARVTWSEMLTTTSCFRCSCFVFCGGGGRGVQREERGRRR